MKTIMIVFITCLMASSGALWAQELDTKVPIAADAGVDHAAESVVTNSGLPENTKNLPEAANQNPQQIRDAEQAAIDEQIDAALLRYSNLRSQFGDLESNWLKSMNELLSRHRTVPGDKNIQSVSGQSVAVQSVVVNKPVIGDSEHAIGTVGASDKDLAEAKQLSPPATNGVPVNERDSVATPEQRSLDQRLLLLESRLHRLERFLKLASEDIEPCAEGEIQP